MKRLIVFTACVLVTHCWASSGFSVAAGRKPASSHRRGYRHPQRAPTRERYKQIQRALAERGYNPGPIDGRWGSRTSAALKRFEKDHHLHADGKLDSLSLITLGLGPRRLTSVSSNPNATTKRKK